MLFQTFYSQEERRKIGGSYFIEFQYCELAPDSKREGLISADTIKMRKNDSLYIYGDDENTFFSCYKDIFTGGTYGNGKTGVVDLCGINYYSVEETECILKKLKYTHLPEQEILAHWLEKARKHSGFYILGL
ncbi:MAG: hypothetical protein ACOX17_07245 [Christensenellales bacterium]|jgi:hypothetical protein